MGFTTGLILLMITAMAAGFLLAAFIFAKPKDGTMYFWTDDGDGKVYTEMQLNENDIHIVAKKRSITLDCVEVMPVNTESHETQGV